MGHAADVSSAHGPVVLAVRLDSDGDVLLTGPALRALAARARRLVLVAGPAGAQAARLLPGVDEVVVWAAPWAGFDPPPVDAGEVERLVARLRAVAADEAVVFTSFHQSPLPAALLLRLAGVARISAISEDYPGSLLDLRHRVPDDISEVHRALSLTTAAGYPAPADDRLQVRPDGVARTVGPDTGGGDPGGSGAARGHAAAPAPRPPYVVVHPGASVPARTASPDRNRLIVAALHRAGRRVVVTGSPDETVLTATVAGDVGVDLGGRTTYPQLAAVLRDADVVVCGNTGPAHLAAAVGTPVVSLFAPVVPAVRWAPYGVPVVVLGDQRAPCAGTRARTCPVPGHPCLDGVPVDDVVAAVDALAPRRAPAPPDLAGRGPRPTTPAAATTARRPRAQVAS